MRVSDAAPRRRTSNSSCSARLRADLRRDLLAHELRARLQLALGVLDVEAPRGAHGVEADGGRAEHDDDQVGRVDPPEEMRPAHGHSSCSR